jgi:hypothetical protein
MRCTRLKEVKVLPSRIKFAFERGGELIADLLPEAAPKTVGRVLDILPYQTTVYHTGGVDGRSISR